MNTTPGHDLPVAAFDFALPDDLIAQEPLEDRAASRLLVLNRVSGDIQHSQMRDLGQWLVTGDLLVVNNTRVLPARLRARKRETGGQVELLLLQHVGAGTWRALSKPVRKLKQGQVLELQPTTRDYQVAPVEVVAIEGDGVIVVHFTDRADLQLEQFGTIPLPPYIRRPLVDPDRYQTVFASCEGSAAAPTAGLHLTLDQIGDFRTMGIQWAEVTLHIGLDTFRPVTVDRVGDHAIHSEWCSVSNDVARTIAATKRDGKRVVAVGTTAARTLETLGQQWNSEHPQGLSGPTNLFITPGYTWRIVDALLTNFHLPRSTLLMMVSALAGRESILHAYHEAIAARYRFFSFGDAMFIS